MIFKNLKTSIFAILFSLLIIAPIAANQYYNFTLKPASHDQTPKPFRINPGQPVVQISQNLKEQNLIRNAFTFRLLVAQMGIGKNIQAGDFLLSANMSSREIARELTHGAIDLWITFPEGLRKEEIAEIIEAKLNSAQNDQYQFDKQEFITLGQEGHLFPDTYLIPRDAKAQAVLDRLSQTFEEKVDKNLLGEGARNNLTAQEVIILASLIEREAKTAEERPVIAGILLNRLNLGIALQVDATVQYAKGYDAAQNTWWPQVSADDYHLVVSAYNTYLNPGLPPAPIANPGLTSIAAAASPATTSYLYYLHDREGNVHYAETIEEHNQNIRQFL